MLLIWKTCAKFRCGMWSGSRTRFVYYLPTSQRNGTHNRYIFPSNVIHRVGQSLQIVQYGSHCTVFALAHKQCAKAMCCTRYCQFVFCCRSANELIEYYIVRKYRTESAAKQHERRRSPFGVELCVHMLLLLLATIVVTDKRPRAAQEACSAICIAACSRNVSMEIRVL